MEEELIVPNNLQEVCRLCLGEDSLEDILKRGDLQQWISDFLSIVISETDPWSTFVCTGCRTRMDEFREFQHSCWKVQDLLQSKILVSEPTDTSSTLRIKEEQLELVEEPEIFQEDSFQDTQLSIDDSSLTLTADETDDALSNRPEVQKIKTEQDLLLEAEETNVYPVSDSESIVHQQGSNTVDTAQQYLQGTKHKECPICHRMYPSLKSLKNHIRRTCSRRAQVNSPVETCSNDRFSITEADSCSSPVPSYVDFGEVKVEQNAMFEADQGEQADGNTVDTEMTYRQNLSESNLQCYICHKVCSSLQGLKNHIKRTCLQPKKKLDKKIRTKLQKVYTEILPHEDGSSSYLKSLRTCPQCGKGFKKSRWEGHMNKHKGIRPFKCEKGCADTDFFCQELRRYHYRFVHGKRAECHICHKEYPSKPSLQLHIKEVHSRHTVTCTRCAQTFTSKSRLTCHMKKCEGKIYRKLINVLRLDDSVTN